VGDLEVKLEQIRGEQVAQAERVERALTEMTAAIRSFEKGMDLIKWLVLAVISASLGADALRLVASVLLKGTP
jgi:hypothetical protein